jgi:hypothetical protein
LRAMTLSNIVNGSGSHITPEALKGIPLTDWFSCLKWPRQPVVTTSQWNLWKHALEATYIRGMHSPHPSWCLGVTSYHDLAQLLWHPNPMSCYISSYDISRWMSLHWTCGCLSNETSL